MRNNNFKWIELKLKIDNVAMAYQLGIITHEQAEETMIKIIREFDPQSA